MNLPYLLKGKVISGKHLGKTVGMKTANLSFDSVKDKIDYGVYASLTTIKGIKYLSVTNVGTRPSVDDDPTPTIETHIIDLDKKLYDEEIEVELVSFIRQIKKFSSLEEVKMQVDKDIEKVKEIFTKKSNEEYVITCSSTCDLSKAYLKENKIPYVSFNFLLGGEKYVDDFYDNIDEHTFCEKIKNEDVKTSQPEPAQYFDMWEEILKDGKDVLHIELSSGISGAYLSSLMVRDELMEKYKDRKIVVIDSKCCSTGYGFLLKEAIKKKNEGLSLEEIEKFVEDLKLKIHQIFVPNIAQLLKGGRLPKAIGMVAKAVNLYVVLRINKDGKLEEYSKVRGTNKMFGVIKDYILENIENGENYSGSFMFNSLECDSSIEQIFNDLKEIYKNASIEKESIYKVGSVIGSHVGDGTFGLYFIGSEK